MWGREYVDELCQVAINPSPNDCSTCSTKYWSMHDVNYNVLGIIDSSGVMKERYEYTPYGERTIYISPGSNDPELMSPILQSQKVVAGGIAQPYGTCDFGMQGKFFDKEFGLYGAWGARAYHPVLARWNQPDPTGYPDGNSRVEWERSNPVTNRDPDGLAILSLSVFRLEGESSKELSEKIAEAQKKGEKFINATKLSDSLQRELGRYADCIKQLNALPEDVFDKSVAQGLIKVNGVAFSTMPDHSKKRLISILQGEIDRSQIWVQVSGGFEDTKAKMQELAKEVKESYDELVIAAHGIAKGKIVDGKVVLDLDAEGNPQREGKIKFCDDMIVTETATTALDDIARNAGVQRFVITSCMRFDARKETLAFAGFTGKPQGQGLAFMYPNGKLWELDVHTLKALHYRQETPGTDLKKHPYRLLAEKEAYERLQKTP